MSHLPAQQTKPTDMLPFAEKLLKTMRQDPSTLIKECLGLCQTYAPLGFDHLKTLYEFQERNIGKLQESSKREQQLVEAVVARQREIMASGIADAWRASGEILLAGTPMDMVARQAEYLKQTSMKLFEEYQEMGKEIATAQANVSQILLNRVEDFMQEVKDLCAHSKLMH
jgi:phasin family protein